MIRLTQTVRVDSSVLPWAGIFGWIGANRPLPPSVVGLSLGQGEGLRVRLKLRQ